MHGFGNMLRDYLDYYHITQSDFADRLGITQKHLNGIINDEEDISIELMLAISLITDIDPNLIAFCENKKHIYQDLRKKFKDEKEVNEYLKTFYIKEADNRRWFRLRDKTNYVQNTMDLLQFLEIRNFNELGNYFNKKVLFKKLDDADEKKIFMWIRRCEDLCKNQEVGDYHRTNLDVVLEKLKKERNKKFNVNTIQKIFNENGIYFVVEEPLKGTKVRGCMTVRVKNPAIYMTTYYKEKSSFYFALYHEIGHIKTDYNMAKSKILIAGSDKTNETKMDNYALEQMIPSKIWEEILLDYDNKERICKKNNIPLTFMYSRLAKEKHITYKDKEYLDNRELI
jgi:HTH-type transcriptional regulator / antitoxin HigA